jgi:predicted amidohydrolase
MAHVHVVQQQIRASNPQQARDEALAAVRSAKVSAGDMIVLCELFSTGFRFDAAELREQGPKDEAFVYALAKEFGCVVAAGHAAERRGKLFNVMSVVEEGKLLSQYAKLHTFGPGGEHHAFERGDALALFRWRAADVLVQPAICYDLRFGELFRGGNESGAEMIVISSAWPSVRVAHWRALVMARAIENQAMVAACNALGDCPAPMANAEGARPAVAHPGSSMIVSHVGEVLADAGAEVRVISAKVDASEIRAWRERFPIGRDRRVIPKV